MNNGFGNKKRIEDYYREEQQYLIEAGREFARAHPMTASYLNIDQIDDRDPYVERLFEGFAFLTGRIRQKLDDELPELTQSLLGFLWPHILNPIPSLSILEFSLIPGRIQEPYIIERDTEIDSQPMGDMDMNVCRFRTCYDVHIRPIRLVEASLESNSVIRFRFEVEGGVDYPSLFTIEGGTEHQKRYRKAIRLLLHDVEQLTASTLQMYLARHVQRVVIQAGTKGSSVTIQGQAGVQMVGLLPEEGLLPYTRQSFSGYRILQEYFVYPRKFFFFDFFGFDQLHPPKGTGNIEVRVLFNKKLPEDIRFTTANFRLHCTPIVNLSKGEANPIYVNHETTEYKVQASEAGFEVFSVDAVTGIVSGTMEERTYVPFYSFRHGISDDRVTERSDGYYHTITRLTFVEEGREVTRQIEKAEGHQDVYIAIVGPDTKIDELREETLSINITCTNGIWARKLRPGDICNPTSNASMPEFVKFRNLTQPTLIVYPPLQAGLEWRFISHLALNYISLNNVEAMRGILGLYNWSVERGQREANINRVEGILSVSARPYEIPYRGSVIRGMAVTLEVDRKKFADEGDIHLFGLILREFLDLYVSINSFIKLTILSHDTKEELFSWDPELMSGKNMASLMGRRRFNL